MKAINLVRKLSIVVMSIGGFATQSLQAEDSLTIVVYGASGRIGEVIVDEALARGHKVTGVSRNPEKLSLKHPNFTPAKGDLMDGNSIGELAEAADAIVISITARARDNRPENSLIVHATRNVVAALARLENKPYIVQVGSANLMYGSSYEEVRENMKQVHFPYEKGSVMYAVLFGHQLSLQMYQASKLAWTIIAPPLKILGIYTNPDSITTKGVYRISTTGPVIAADGSKTIYVRDLAKAAVNEIENKKFPRQVFTVAY